MSDSKWWGYIARDGTAHVKRFYEERDVYDKSLEPGVIHACGPFQATGRTAAMAHVLKTARGGA